MANENVVIRRGPAANLPEAKVPGQILVATDTGEMYVDDTADSRVAIGGKDPSKLPLTGGTLTGPLLLPSNQSTNSNAAVRYKWVMDQISNVSTDMNEQISALQTAVNDAAPAVHADSDGAYGKSSATMYGHAKASQTTPKAAGTAAVGTESSSFARGDHVHPLQTSVSGNAGTATKLATARTITLTGAITGSASFDGSANVSIACTSAGGGDIDDGAIS